jgi:molybdopterin/thiamine biosynthesis adenylyltransferase/rhodanese-related sulfurtransferase
MTLSAEEYKRYARHISLEALGEAGQEKLKKARVLCVGAGGLGSPASLYLAAAGVGELGIIDHDNVDLSNLQRQILFSSHDVGHNKALTAKTCLLTLNPLINITAYPEKLSPHNARNIFKLYDIIVDGSDNFPTRYLCNDASFHVKVPLISASIFQFAGQLSVFNYKDGPCYRCLYPAPPPPNAIPNCAENGVLGAVTGVFGAMQASEAIKIITENGTIAAGKLIVFDLLTLENQQFHFEKSRDCLLCQDNTAFEQLPRYENNEQTTCQTIPSLSVSELSHFKGTLIDIRQPYEVAASKIPNSIAIPQQELSIEQLHQHASPYLLYCQSGMRSSKTTSELMKQGAKEIYNLTGGINAWEAERTAC